MFRNSLKRSGLLSFAFKRIRKVKLFCSSRTVLEKDANCLAYVPCIYTPRIPNLVGNSYISESVCVKFACSCIINLNMSPSKKNSLVSSPTETKSKRKHKSKHKDKLKSKHKHEKLKFKHKHSKRKSKYKSKHKHKKHKSERNQWSISSINIRTLGELVVATCSKIAGISTDRLQCCDQTVSGDKSSSCKLTSAGVTYDVNMCNSERDKPSSRSHIGPNNKTVSKLNSNVNSPTCTKDDSGLLGDKGILSTADSAVSSLVNPQLFNFADREQDAVLKNSSLNAFSCFESKVAQSNEDVGFQKPIGIGLSPLQDIHVLAASTKNVETPHGGQCLEPGRYWIYSETMMEDTSKWKKFKLMSYNVLSQSLLEEHPYLYRRHDERALEWTFRSQLLFAEIKNLDADILCLQEIEYNHLHIFEKQLQSLGYRGIYKKRSHQRVDGVAIFYKPEVFTLLEYTSVEFFQPNVTVLNRDNVALVAKLAHKDLPDEGIVVATTHLLFNMNRHDVKLAQTQLLLAEVERFAYAGIGKLGPRYLPVIITGDMNFKPFTGVYDLLTKGRLRYEGLLKKNLTNPREGFGTLLNKTLLPRWLQVTDSCQHWGILPLRDRGVPNRAQEIPHLKIQNSDFILNLLKHGGKLASAQKHTDSVKLNKLPLKNVMSQPGSSHSQPTGQDKKTENIETEDDVLPSDRFGTGVLTHPFNLQSAYTDHDSEVTTYHNTWVTVDYIFYSLPKNEMESGLSLLATYKLPTFDEAVRWGHIPNFNSPSDHYPLLVMFGLDSELQKAQN